MYAPGYGGTFAASFEQTYARVPFRFAVLAAIWISRAVLAITRTIHS